MQDFRFTPLDLPPETETLRGEVRAFLDETIGHEPPVLRSRTWSRFDGAFSRKLGDKGWIGMTWPRAYGGHERSALERYVVLEELLAAGAPCSAHWTGDRQSGPLLLNRGTEEQRRRFLPGIAAGEIFFCIGMSEPDTGSDLASVRTRADRTDGGYIVNGTKIWTSNAHECDHMIALLRTDTEVERKHDGLSQFILDLKAPGVTARPIRNLADEDHFNEVVFQDVFVPDDLLVGREGDGWAQVTSELAFERSGPERYLSSWILVEEMLRAAGPEPSERRAIALGRLVAHAAVLREMSLSVAGQLQRGEDPSLEATLVKDLGALLEQQIPEVAHELYEEEPTLETASDLAQVTAYLVQAAPSFSLRGGAREILRGIIARGLGLR